MTEATMLDRSTNTPGDNNARPAVSGTAACWICGSSEMRLLRRGNLPLRLQPDAFRITDAGYGRTGDLYQCSRCGFRQCAGMDGVLAFYESMDDASYEATRGHRALQARRLVRSLGPVAGGRRLLDIGAGSGILVEEALAAGWQAEGVEPSVNLAAFAAERGLPVQRGVLPHAKISGPFDVITLVDVIEHVPDPLGLLRIATSVLAPGGRILIVTPDVNSVAARGMGARWWHYRIAHIGYFNRATLARAAVQAGLMPISVTRPSWYLPAGYLLERLFKYLPRALRPPVPLLFDRITVPLNLFDSLAMICTTASSESSA